MPGAGIVLSNAITWTDGETSAGVYTGAVLLGIAAIWRGSTVLLK